MIIFIKNNSCILKEDISELPKDEYKITPWKTMPAYVSNNNTYQLYDEYGVYDIKRQEYRK